MVKENKRREEMRKLMLVLLGLLFIGHMSYAEDYGLTLKQGGLYLYEDGVFRNFTCAEIARTTANPNWDKWVNAIWSGWTAEGGVAYDASSINTLAIMVGRKIGTLGDYLPINYPLLDKVDISVYPIGVACSDIGGKPQFQAASGAAIIKLDVKF
jgi:hypothetical protein